MPADYYSDAAPAASEPEMPEEQEDMDEYPTAEVPKSILGGKTFNPGDEVVLEVVQVMEDSVLVRYATGEKDEEAPAETPETPSAPEEPSSPGTMNSMY